MAKVTLKLPKLAVSMREGLLAEWLVNSGDTVALGQRIYVVETEKTTIEVESPFAGQITLIAEPGQTLPVGAPIADLQT